MKNDFEKTQLSMGNLYRALLVIIGIVLIVAIGCNYFIRQNLKNSVAAVFSESMGKITDKLDEELDSIEYVLTNQYARDERLLNYDEMSRTDQIYAMNVLCDEFINLKLTMDSGYHFFVYLPDEENVICEYENYSARQDLKLYLKTLCQNAETIQAATGFWKLCEGNEADMFLRIIPAGNEYVGCWLDFSKIKSEYMDVNMQSCEVFAVRGDSVITDQKLYENLTGKDVPKLDTKKVNRYVGDTYFMLTALDNTDHHLLIAGSNFNIYESYILVQGGFIALLAVMLGLGIYFLWVLQCKIILPLRDFSTSLEKYVQNPDVSHYYQFKELQEVNDVFMQLGQQVKKLKFDMYEQELEHQKIEMGYLQEQIKPHFYLNCMSVIYNMAQVKRCEEISRLSMEVASYLRFIFQNGMTPVSIRAELAHIDHYMNIQKIRYDETFSYLLDVDEGVLDEKIPPLMIQTLVENSVKYGLMREEPLKVSVSVRSLEQNTGREGDMEAQGAACKRSIVIVVADNGPGFPEAVLEKLWAKEEIPDDERAHVGINNLCKRLRYMFGEDADITFENDHGARVTVVIPEQKGVSMK